MFLAAWLFVTRAQSVHVSALVLAGDHVYFAAGGTPLFTQKQFRDTAEATRVGLAKWSRTEHGRRLIAYLDPREYAINVTEDAGENAPGRAPPPGIATLIAAHDHVKLKSYELILNPTFFRLPKGMEPMPYQPATAADMMAVAWAGEMLHIYFYAQGISLPHHPRIDFQDEWRAIASELGMPMVVHDDDGEATDAMMPHPEPRRRFAQDDEVAGRRPMRAPIKPPRIAGAMP